MTAQHPTSPPEPPGSLLLCFCVALATLGAESGIAALLLSHHAGAALYLHGLVVTLLLANAGYARRNNRFGFLLLIMTATTGPFGAAICLLASLVYAFSARTSASPSEWIDTFFAQTQTGENERLRERIELGLDNSSSCSGVEPFQDILNSGTVVQKQMAIAKITRYFRPQFAPLLRQAVENENAAVRVQAATALAKIERDFTLQYMQLEKKLAVDPDDGVTRLALARLCDDYAHAGLQDDHSCHALRAKAIALYDAHLAQRDDYDTQLHLARLYLRDGQPESACFLLRGIVESGDVTPAGIFWYMEALFRLKKLREIRWVASRYARALAEINGPAFPAQTEGVLHAWGQAGSGERPVYAA